MPSGPLGGPRPFAEGELLWNIIFSSGTPPAEVEAELLDSGEPRVERSDIRVRLNDKGDVQLQINMGDRYRFEQNQLGRKIMKDIIQNSFNGVIRDEFIEAV